MKMKRVLLVVLLVSVFTTGYALSARGAGDTYEGFPVVLVQVNGNLVTGDVPAINFFGRTLVPIRFVSEALGANVAWDADTRTASVNLMSISEVQRQLDQANTKIAQLEAALTAVTPQRETSTAANGDKFDGYLLNGKRNGQGTSVWANGDTYVGEYKDGVRTGQGTYTWPIGSRYVGGFKNNLLHGLGTYTWPSGSKYVGEWKDGRRNGVGMLHLPDGTFRAEKWTDGTLTTSSSTMGFEPDAPVLVKKTVEDITAQMKSKVFRIDLYDKAGAFLGSGTAVAVGRHEVITNYHVISHAASATLIDEAGRILDVVGITASTLKRDLAVLRVAENLEAVELRTVPAKVGEEIVAMSGPFGLTNVVSTGNVGAHLSFNGRDVFQSSAPISQASSGGAVFDRQGQLLGITFGGVVQGQELNLTIPIKYIETLVINGRSRPVRSLPGEGLVAPADLVKAVGQTYPVMTLGTVSIYPKFDLIDRAAPKAGQASEVFVVLLDLENYERYLDGLGQGDFTDRTSQIQSYLEQIAEAVQLTYPGLEVEVDLVLVGLYDHLPVHYVALYIGQADDKWLVTKGLADVTGKSGNWRFLWW